MAEGKTILLEPTAKEVAISKISKNRYHHHHSPHSHHHHHHHHHSHHHHHHQHHHHHHHHQNHHKHRDNAYSRNPNARILAFGVLGSRGEAGKVEASLKKLADYKPKPPKPCENPGPQSPAKPDTLCPIPLTLHRP